MNAQKVDYLRFNYKKNAFFIVFDWKRTKNNGRYYFFAIISLRENKGASYFWRRPKKLMG